MLDFQFAIFDCDGTLVDTEAACNRALHRSLSEIGLTLSEEELFDVVIGRSTADTSAQLALLIPGAAAELIAERIELAEIEAVTEAINPMLGAADALARWQDRCCVASNGALRKMRASLTSANLISGIEDRLFSSEQVARPKPFPDLFLHCAAHFGVSPVQCVVVEDSRAGIEAAVAAGMTVYGLTHHLSPDEVISAGGRVVDSLLAWLALPESILSS